MAQFHIHPDSIIYVRTARGTYVDTPANFARDHGAAAPAMPKGAVQALYDDVGKVLQFFDAKNNQIGVGQRGGWPFGETAIAAVSKLLAAQAKRTAPAAVAPAQTIKKATP